MRDGDISSMDYDQAVSKTGKFSLVGPMWMEADGYSAGAPITFNLITEAEPIPIMEKSQAPL